MIEELKDGSYTARGYTWRVRRLFLIGGTYLETDVNGERATLIRYTGEYRLEVGGFRHAELYLKDGASTGDPRFDELWASGVEAWHMAETGEGGVEGEADRIFGRD